MGKMIELAEFAMGFLVGLPESIIWSLFLGFLVVMVFWGKWIFKEERG